MAQPPSIYEQEHEDFRAMARTFMEKEVAPHMEQWEKDGQVSRELWLKAGEQGLLCFDVPEEFGGMGVDDFRYNAIVSEELSRIGASGPGFPVHTDIIVPYITSLGTDEQKQRWLPGLVSGELISAEPYVPITWATGVDKATGRPLEAPGVRYRDAPSLQVPAPFGAHNWHPMAFNPQPGLVYIPAQVVPFAYVSDAGYKHQPGGWNVGTDFIANSLPDDAAQMAALKAMVKGQLIAWDPVAQKARWTVEHPFFWNAGVLTTAGGLVFQGVAEGQFAAYDAATGDKLWSYETVNGVIAPPSTYEVDGEQYVALMVGYGGAGALSSPALLPARSRLPGRLLVFKLGGKAQAPAYDMPEQPALDLAGVTSSGDPKAGFATFQQYCQGCHGPNVSGRFLPDLKRSQMLLSEESWRSVLIDGALAPRGMASFSRFLTPQEAENVRAYVLAEARKGGTPVPPSAGPK